jgi:hypothetical protein
MTGSKKRDYQLFRLVYASLIWKVTAGVIALIQRAPMEQSE